MYAAGTILKLKKPRSTDEVPFAYDTVEVIGQSPMSHSSRTSEWTGGNADGVIIKPLTEFSSTLDEPYGRLREMYDVHEQPEKVAPQHKDIKVVNHTNSEGGQTPEEIFEDANGGKPQRAKAPKKKPSPLGDEPVKSSISSPLDG